MKFIPYVAGITFLISTAIFAQTGYLYAKSILAQYLLEQAWDKSLLHKKNYKPWPWADTKPVAKLKFIKQSQDYIVLAGSSGRSLAFAPGHLSGTALPGEPGHSVISAHRDTHFGILQHIQINDIIKIQTVQAQELIYQVSSIEIVDIRKDRLELEPDQINLTLITCYPFDSLSAETPFRLRVNAVNTDMFSFI